MKKIFSILGGMAILALASISFTSAYTQEQIEAYQWAYKYRLTTQPTIEQAKMNSPLTRQAFAKMVVSYLENVVGVNQSTSNSCYFPDESKITNDLKYYTKKTCGYQIMGSNGKNFNPTQTVDRAQLGTVLSRILWGDKHNVDGKGYYIYHVNALKDAGIMSNITNVLGTPAKRGDVLIMFKRMYEKFGSNVYMNGNKVSTNSTNNTIKTTSSNSTDNNSSKTPVVRKTDSNGFSYYDSYLDNPRLSNAMKDMKLRSTSCENIFCQQVGDDGTYSNQKHYYWNDEEGTMTLIPGVYYISDCAYYDRIYGSSSSYSYDVEDEDDDDYISSVYDNSSVIYTSKDGTKYYYDDEFLDMLKATAEKKGETDLAKYLDVELKYYDSSSEFEFDPEEFYETLGIDLDNIDPNSLTKKQKEEIAEKFGTWADGVAKKVREINEEYENDLEKVVKNAKNDKFGLKEKYNKTKDYLEYGNTFLDGYCKSVSSLLKIMLTAEEDEDNTEEVMRVYLSVMSLTLELKTKADEYNKFNEGWVKDTIDLLGGELIY